MQDAFVLLFREAQEPPNPFNSALVETVEPPGFTNYLARKAAYVWLNQQSALKNRSPLPLCENRDNDGGKDFIELHHTQFVTACTSCILKQINEDMRPIAEMALTKGLFRELGRKQRIQFDNQKIAQEMGVCPRKVSRLIEEIRNQVEQCNQCKGLL